MFPVIQKAANLVGQGNDLKNSIRKVIIQTLEDSERRYDRYLMLLGGSKVLDELVDFLLGLKWLILNAPIGVQFITSDNPGFNLNDKYQISKFGGFGDEFTQDLKD